MRDAVIVEAVGTPVRIGCGLQTTCEGGGQANATILELL